MKGVIDLMKKFKIEFLVFEEDILFPMLKNIEIINIDEKYVKVKANPLDMKIYELQRMVRVIVD
jgi:hypothetical protein